MKSILSLILGLRRAVTAAGLAILLATAAGCGPGRPAVETYLVSVTNASPAQAAEARQYIAGLFAELAAKHGLAAEKPLPTDAVALYFPRTDGLNLSLSAITTGANNITISVIPVEQGKRNNADCRAVIAAVEQALTKQFAARLLKSP